MSKDYSELTIGQLVDEFIASREKARNALDEWGVEPSQEVLFAFLIIDNDKISSKLGEKFNLSDNKAYESLIESRKEIKSVLEAFFIKRIDEI